jgi:hypothetical protein
MPTIQKLQLKHTAFSWHEQSDRFLLELEAQRAPILEHSGFNREFDNPDGAANINAETEAAAMRMDAGFKATNKIIATLKSIAKDPSTILRGGVEPEALAMVASNYQRDDEEPGIFWFDVDKSDNTPFPDTPRVSKAAFAAIDKLSARRGQPRNVMLEFLGGRLLACYLRFNLTAGRHSIAADGDRAQAISTRRIE